VKASFSIFHRCFTAIVGLFFGGFVGMLALYFVMLVSGSDFGLDNVRLGAMFGAVIGFLFGLGFPHRWSWLDFLP
jgi:presenilin-like A22 family membrane protease